MRNTSKAASLLAMVSIIMGAAGPARATPGDVTKSMAAPSGCVTGLTWDGRHLWVADHKTDRLTAIDRSGHVVASLPSPGHRPAGLAWDGRYLWNVDQLRNKIYRVDPRTGITVHTMDSPVSAPTALAWDGKALWISDRRTGTLRRIDPDDGTTIRSIPAPRRSVDGLVWDGRYLFATDRLHDLIYMLEPSRGEVIFSFKSPGPFPTGIAFDGSKLYVADYETDHIDQLVYRDRTKVQRRLIRREDITFTYQVRNYGPGTLTSMEIALALPRSEATQKLETPLTFVSPPTLVKRDNGGLKVALFRRRNVRAGQTVTVAWKTKVALYSVRHYVFPDTIGPLSAIPTTIRRKYLRNDRKYSITDPIIKKAVRQAVGRQRNPYWMARRIFRYIHKKMHYELAGGWNTAPRVLARGSGSCSEYSFVFISMCRAAGIPARYVGSIVRRRDNASWDDVYHRWVEIYLPGHGWLPVDPSRGDKPTQAQRGDAFFHLTADFVITTRSPGPSRYLDWSYNGMARWQCRGRCKVEEENIAEWSPRRRPSHRRR